MKLFRRFPKSLQEYQSPFHNLVMFVLVMIGIFIFEYITQIGINKLFGLEKDFEFAFVVFGAIGLSLIMISLAIRNSIGRGAWLKAAIAASMTIVRREEEVNDPKIAVPLELPEKDWYLVLEMLPDQLAEEPEDEYVFAHVSESVYKKYEGRTSVTVYYLAEKPLEFLLEDEVPQMKRII